MKTYKMVPTQTLNTVSCDICKMVFVNDFENDNMEIENMLNIEYTFGYGSKRDGETWVADICMQCVEKNLLSIMHKEKT